jgi:tRNA U54 and U55 pseudouridine synthase Pus10
MTTNPPPSNRDPTWTFAELKTNYDRLCKMMGLDEFINDNQSDDVKKLQAQNKEQEKRISELEAAVKEYEAKLEGRKQTDAQRDAADELQKSYMDQHAV